MGDHSMSSAHSSDAVKRFDKLYEFDREPVPRDKLLGPSHFAGSFAGEHVAATEFVIGVLFVNWGASVKDVFVGLAIGNVLAVLTWALICAPIAVQTRLTLYWYLRRIGGPYLAVIYNVLNAVLFCILAGCMITVAASAVRIPFGIAAQTLWYPTDFRFVLVVLGVGAVVITLAILGFKKLAAFATVCSPWMFLMFFAGSVAMLPRLCEAAGFVSIDGLSRFWEMGGRVVWTGETPDGSEPMGFWRVAAFAWICNLAMHGGLSDMALFRFAKKARYGLFSAFGMFLGHYLAWICAGMMGVGAALLLNQSLTDLDAGAVGYEALGLSGALAVIIAGWTTSNPTLYRAGLAFQAVTPDWSRSRVTFVVGVITTIIACFPFVFTKLLDFVGIYGLLLVPAGAIVLTEHWIFPRVGLTRYWASARKLSMNWPALIAWVVAIAFALVMERTGTLHLFYLFLPVYVLTAVLYIALAAMAGARESVSGADESVRSADAPPPQDEIASAPARHAATPMLVKISGLIALACLLTCLLLPLILFLGAGENYEANLAGFKKWLILPTTLYLVTGTIYYVKRK
jgi:NCS1 family nucleobase:cation symporter-1